MRETKTFRNFRDRKKSSAEEKKIRSLICRSGRDIELSTNLGTTGDTKVAMPRQKQPAIA